MLEVLQKMRKRRGVWNGAVTSQMIIKSTALLTSGWPFKALIKYSK